MGSFLFRNSDDVANKRTKQMLINADSENNDDTQISWPNDTLL